MISIIPTPKSIKAGVEFFDITRAVLKISKGTDARVVRAFENFLCEVGACGNVNPISVSHGDGGDGYTLSVGREGITITADGAAGAFYAVQTLRQIVHENGKNIPCCLVEDCPDFAMRGFYHDITRGRVPTLRKLKEIVDTLSYYKINSLQLYVEDAFTFRELDGIVSADCALTPEEIRELDAYCHEHFIDLVPSMATFGHLYTLLQSEKYNHICELKGHEPYRNYWLERQWHHTVDVYNPETIEVIGSMLRQYIPLFSSKYFNICCDETMDLCGGTNAGRDKGEAYFHHLNKLIEIVKSHGKTVMMWGDECMARPELFAESVPRDTIILNWCYRRQVNEWIPKFFWEQGFSQICCTGTSCWENFIENVNISTGNITSFASHAKKYGALGILNTNWGDFGHVCPFNSNLYGLLFGAQKSWNVDAPTDDEFERAASLLLYKVTEFNMVETLRALGRAASSCSWSDFVVWHSANFLEEKDEPLHYGWGKGGPLTAEDVSANIEICRAEIARLEALGRRDSIFEDLILSARALELMNRQVLYVNGVDGDGSKLQNDFNLWLKDYRGAWLRDDKPSDLWRIEEFIKNITALPEK